MFWKRFPSLSRSVVVLSVWARIAEEGFRLSSCESLGLCIQMVISFLFSFAFRFSASHGYVEGLPRQPCCFLAFLFHGDGLDPCLLHRVTSLLP